MDRETSTKVVISVVHAADPVGASLLAIAVDQSVSM
ncbi:hypothetical protein SAMN05216476_3196 [Pseudomonas mediterranea]|uniref:Uncharacterized protein n=1 Tax=Pseudomonas mediterranea TaxID=183795 RepID=A0AAX2DD41_9PSED|nr:hypothetical protein SAMN05216476_3196 [Pseudomonas mediterranea]